MKNINILFAKRYVYGLALSVFIGIVFSQNYMIPKSDLNMKNIRIIEPDFYRGTGTTRETCPHQYPVYDYGASSIVVIDSSANGYGLVRSQTRPIDIKRDADGEVLVSYRQYVGVGATHGQLGTAHGIRSEDGSFDWTIQYNINMNGNPPWGPGDGKAQGRYSSIVAGKEYPYAIWNEYTNNEGIEGPCQGYGGRPYFSYDEFGWGGESWQFSVDLDPLWDCSKDLWVGSVGYGYDEAQDKQHISAVFDDWTRDHAYLFTSESVGNGYIVMDAEQIIVNNNNLGTDDYSTPPTISMNDNGQGVLGLIGIFDGVNVSNGSCSPPASDLTCNKTAMFKITDDYGESWGGMPESFDFYYVPDAVFDDILETFPAYVMDECTGEAAVIDGYFSWYEFDMRVDNEGNPHIVMSITGQSESHFHMLEGRTGFYHLTIDRDNLDNPGAVNTPTGWNWSYIPIPVNNSFAWSNSDGQSYLYGTMCQLSISYDDPNVIYAVANAANNGEMAAEHDQNGDGIEDDPCGTQTHPWQLYPEWSQDIWVAKSLDNGSTWISLVNVTNTPRAGTDDDCAPEETFVHTAHWTDNDNGVYMLYQQPNWGFNELDEQKAEDHMNRLFAGFVEIEDGACYTDIDDCGVCGGDNATCLDCGGVVNGGGVCIGFGDINGTEGTIDIVYQSDNPIAGFQFDISGIEIIGGESDLETVYFDSNNTLFVGLGLDGESLPPPSGVLATLSFIPDSNDITSCLTGGIVGGGGGIEHSVYDGDCTVIPACNNIDCDGVCGGLNMGNTMNCCSDGFGPNDEVADCAGVCGGDNVLDVCWGVCEINILDPLGDVNQNGEINVVDLLMIVGFFLEPLTYPLDETQTWLADYNKDCSLNILDLVGIINIMFEQLARTVDAVEEITIYKSNTGLYIDTPDFVALDIELSHIIDFEHILTSNAFLNASKTTGNTTRLIIIEPVSELLFETDDEFEIESITAVGINGESVEVSILVMPTEFNLSPAYPNPFNPVTTLKYSLPSKAQVSIIVYNIQGGEVEVLLNENKDFGYHSTKWNADKYSSGLYFVQMVAGNYKNTQKIMLVK